MVATKKITLKDLRGEDFTFKLRQIGAMVALDKGIRLSPDRFKIEVLKNEGQYILKVLVDLLTQEQEVMKIPANWWEGIKLRWFPQQLLARYPVKWDEIWAVHKFPELDTPVLGREFVHLKLIKQEELDRLGEVNAEKKE